MLVEKGQKSTITTQIELEESVAAPVAQGQRLGTMTIKAGDQVLSEVPLVASETVERLSWGDIFVKVLRRAAMAK
jgi:D-alanyl-D-alanine carboxypeptidase (penicillin-binding protein 5/6)